jgi:hypothetical protein
MPPRPVTPIALLVGESVKRCFNLGKVTVRKPREGGTDVPLPGDSKREQTEKTEARALTK